MMVSMDRKSWSQSLTIGHAAPPATDNVGEPRKILQIKNIDGIQSALVGAGTLNVARLLAAVADTLSSGLLRAVTR